jgi:hypothetical protein
MALRISDDDQKMNIGQTHSDELFNNLRNTESNGTINDTGDDINNNEKNPNTNWQSDAGWSTNVSGNKPETKNKGLLSLKKKGPLTAIIITLLIGGAGIGGILSPGLLIVHMKEVMVEKFNTQLASMDIRTTQILTTKMGTTGGVCSSIVNIRCKYTTMSEKQIANFEKAGIKVEFDDKNFFGRAKPKSFTFNGGKPISASDFAKEIKTNTEFRSALRTAYNPKFAGFADSIWKKVSLKLGISKTKTTISGATEEEKLKSVQEITKNGVANNGEIKIPSVNDIKPDGTKYTEDEINNLTDAAKAANDISKGAGEISSTGKKIGSEVLSNPGKAVSSISNVFKITGFADSACTAYTTIQAVGYAAKTVRTLQLARYAMMFLNVADQIKAGVADPDQVSYLGKVLTTEVAANTATGAASKKSASDSFGYKYAAYNEAGLMPDTSMQYLAAGGLSGSLIGITTQINSALRGTPRSTCKFLGNPIVGGVSMITGIALAIFAAPIGISKIAFQVAVQASLTLATAALPAMLQDIVAGVLVDNTTVGEDAGDAFTSGASGMMGSAASAGGNAPLTPSEAVAYSQLSNNIAALYNEDERSSSNQFDITNSNTFLGNITSRLTPYLSKMSSLSGFFSSITSMSTSSLSSVIYNRASANSGSYNYEACEDFDYNDLKGDGSNIKLATDPFCNVTYGIPVEALNISPLEVLDILTEPDTSGKRLGQFPQINSETGEPIGEYANFVNNCINRNRSLGDQGIDSGSDGSECLFGEKIVIKEASLIDPEVSINNKYYYLFNIDQRVQKGMDGEDPVLAAAEASGLNSISFFDNNYDLNNTALNMGGY